MAVVQSSGRAPVQQK